MKILFFCHRISITIQIVLPNLINKKIHNYHQKLNPTPKQNKTIKTFIEI